MAYLSMSAVGPGNASRPGWRRVRDSEWLQAEGVERDENGEAEGKPMNEAFPRDLMAFDGSGDTA